MPVSKRTRFEVFKRDRFTCQYCGRTPPQVVLHADHVVPQSAAGGDDPLNLVTSCEDCNLGKSNVPLASVPRPLAELAAQEAERREQMAALEAFLRAGREAEAATVEALGCRWYNAMAARKRDRDKWVFGPARAASVRQFLKHLPVVVIEDAVDIAAGRVPATPRDDESRWRYFCGVCWNKVREAHGQ